MTAELIIEQHITSIIRNNDKVYKQLKQLCRKTTGEILKVYGDDIIIVCKYNAKVIGMCSISMKSPGSHFIYEKYREIPYLYNYICDINYRKYKPSVAIMNYIKKWVDEKLYGRINLDVAVGNDHAARFFIRNRFIECGKYGQATRDYIMYTYESTTRRIDSHESSTSHKTGPVESSTKI